tara:strand:+ start:6986 stop:7303 length:318 start_codon:yes stop_codon:yes gene_type:complete
MAKISECPIDEIRLTNLVIDHHANAKVVDQNRYMFAVAQFAYYMDGDPVGEFTINGLTEDLGEELNSLIDAIEETVAKRMGFSGQSEEPRQVPKGIIDHGGPEEF